MGIAQKIRDCAKARSPTNTATPVLRAGFTEVLVTGMLIGMDEGQRRTDGDWTEPLRCPAVGRAEDHDQKHERHDYFPHQGCGQRILSDMKFCNPFGVEGELRRGEKALLVGRLGKAALLFDRVWNKLASQRNKGRPNTSRERRALIGLMKSSVQAAELDQAVGYCRTGRALGLDEDVFYEFSCTHLFASGGTCLPEDINDLVEWACWPRARKSSVSLIEVESCLRISFIRPGPIACSVIGRETSLDKLWADWKGPLSRGAGPACTWPNWLAATDAGKMLPSFWPALLNESEARVGWRECCGIRLTAGI